MRITVNDSPGIDSPHGDNIFDQFAYTDDDVRLPGKDYMKEAKKLPVSKISSSSNKRRIVLSDEDDEDGWMDSRDVKNISDKDRERNKKIAMAQRKAVSQTKFHPQIKKAPRTKYADDDDEIEIVDSPPHQKKTDLKKVLAKSNLIANSLLQGNDSEESELDPVEEVRRFKLKEKETNRANRAANRGKGSSSSSRTKKAIDLRSSSEEEADDSETEEDDDDDEEDSDDDRWKDNLGQGELRDKAHAVLQHCDSVSVNLRLSLKEWQQSSSSSGKATTAEEKDCVDLIAINENKTSGGAAQILHAEDITVLCPDLQLKAYQLVGVNWMKLLHENDVNGVLADDMGLGKTVQTIAFIAWLKSRANSTGKKTRPHFIVVPASTLANWQNELHRFCPSLRVITYHGSQTERSNLRQELRVEISEGTVDVILSTYTIFERESGKVDRAFLAAQSFDYMILDEAHCIKNADSSRYVNLNMLKTRHRLLLSGTPVQNDLGELLSMLSFLMPGVFGRDNCSLLMDAFGFNKGSATSSNGNVTLQQLRAMLVPFVLRRLKRDVLDQLTEKTNRLEKLNMTDFQRKVYDSVLLGHTMKKDRQRALQEERERELSALDAKPVKKSSSALSLKDNMSSSSKGSAKSGPKKLTKLAKELIDLTSPAPPPKKSESISDMASVGEVLIDLVGDDATSTVDLDVLDAVGELKVNMLTQESTSGAVSEMSASEANHLFTALRKAANHPLLLRVRYKEEKVMDRIAQVAYHQEHFGNQCDFARVRAELDKYSDFDLHLICVEYPDLLSGYELEASVLYDSPKMKKLRDMLPVLQAEGHRMLIFSQWTRLLDLLGVLLYDMHMPFLRLDGSTPIKERQELIDTYNTDKSIPVFLLSTKAGGLGINLTAADTVIMHDLDFNPENDRQAEDRCHRIGQTRPVTVYKLVTEGTVDELIYEMGERKRQLSQAVLSDERQSGGGRGATGKSPGGRGAGSSSGIQDESEENAISNMLQKALAQRALVSASTAAGSDDLGPITVSPDSVV